MAAMTTALVLIGAGPSQAAGSTIHGCPSGAVCVYPENAGWNGDRPSLEFWSYGAHNLSNQYGNHYVLNNQTDWVPPGGGYAAAMATGDTGYNGTGTQSWTLINYIHSGAGGYSAWGNFNLTPINSIDLWITGP
jgi:hypothetical protein